MGDLFALLLTVLLIAANAFFVAAEFALISARRDRLEALAEQGKHSAVTVIKAGEDLAVMLAGAQLGITIGSIILGRVGEPAIAHLLEEVKAAPLDDASRARLREIHATSIRELEGGLAPELREELQRLALPFSEEVPSESELRVAQAQLVGWLEGLFHGIQATLFAQQMAARQQFDQMRQIGHAPEENSGVSGRPGTYL